MECVSLFGLIVLLASCQAVQTCTSMLHQEKILPENQILKLTTPGMLSCFSACLIRHRCMSFNFNTETDECQLNGNTRDSALTLLTKNEDFAFSDISHCKVTGCLGRPAGLENGQLNETHISVESPLGAILSYTCDPGYMPQGELVCQDDGTWSSPVCASVSSCSMVKQYQPGSEDGEYWLRLTNFDNYTTQMYCHNLATSSPQEFLTLPNINYGIYPQIMNKRCKGETVLKLDCSGRGGEIWFNKIRVNVNNMEVFRADKTFAKFSQIEVYLAYGQAYDCYTTDQMNCGRDIKGKFILDLRGTGWRVGKEQGWKTFGHAVKIQIERQINGTLITLRCGGFGGGCRPANRKLVLTPFPEGMDNYNP